MIPATGSRTILVVDDEPNAVKVLSAILREEGYHVLASMNVDHAVSVMKTEDVDAVITDMKMPGKDGFQLFNYISQHHQNTPVMFLTAYGSVESAVQAMTSGAYHYFIKPPDYTKLKDVLAAAIEQNAAKKQVESLKRQSCERINLWRVIGKTPSMDRITQTIEMVKDSESSVLIQGDTGTGKEVIACNLHFLSKRFNKPFVAVNCAAIPRELLESELFGYEKGAFTGATASRTGKFEEAAEGTMFLDEIGEMELPVQAKLLRALQEREIERLGTNKKIKVNFRLISSSNKDLKHAVEQGRFREDLYYRLNVVQIDVPPLRERKGDIPLLATEILNDFSVRENRLFSFTDEVMSTFIHYQWPGNIRQLRNVIERAVVLAKNNHISMTDLPEELHRHLEGADTVPDVKSLKTLERQAISEALQVFNGNKSKAARNLGISRKTLYKILNDQGCSAA